MIRGLSDSVDEEPLGLGLGLIRSASKTFFFSRAVTDKIRGFGRKRPIMFDGTCVLIDKPGNDSKTPTFKSYCTLCLLYSTRIHLFAPCKLRDIAHFWFPSTSLLNWLQASRSLCFVLRRSLGPEVNTAALLSGNTHSWFQDGGSINKNKSVYVVRVAEFPSASGAALVSLLPLATLHLSPRLKFATAAQLKQSTQGHKTASTLFLRIFDFITLLFQQSSRTSDHPSSRNIRESSVSGGRTIVVSWSQELNRIWFCFSHNNSDETVSFFPQERRNNTSCESAW